MPVASRRAADSRRGIAGRCPARGGEFPRFLPFYAFFSMRYSKSSLIGPADRGPPMPNKRKSDWLSFVLKHVAEQELDYLGLVAGLIVERPADTQADRPDWRLPGRADAGRVTEVTGFKSVEILIDIAEIHEN